ncbi:E3 ubiquitin-protein ligase JMJ24 [Cardamine amara subsp. amara]|uniref:E3 ubiquitin-protein ligase JMJ24 n=1 Tax=Cardamine amara subsp. amara TaxID=228776 RepID=A0ABD1AQT7_CARAN
MAIESEKPSKRTTNPGVRVIGGRIYDSSNGKTCHQCRQKTMDFVASCKSINKSKTCPINYCHKCLINRYGENAEEVAKLDNWICPKCRDNCNCSFCMKKRGLNPTGILAHKAKASGLSSVSQLLELEGNDKFTYQKKLKLDDTFVESVSETDDEVADFAKENKKVVGKNKRKLKEETQFEAENVVKEENKVVGKSKRKVKKEIQFEAKPQDVTKEKRKVKEEIQFEAKLPQGFSLTSVSGIVIPTEEVGNVLQFFEFCLAFGKVLDLKKGQAENVVRELFLCRRNTRQQYCYIIQMMIQLLDFMSQDREMSLSLNETNSNWFTVLGELLLQSEVLSDEFPPETFEAEYEKMESSRRLKLLNFLCDESLNTGVMRDYIKSQSEECGEQKKEAKLKAAAAKEKEKQLKQKIQSDVAKAIMKKKGAPLSIEEHNSILSQIRAEAKEAHEEMMEAKGVTSRTMFVYDALRTEPILVEENGLVLWKLKCYEEEPSFLLQDLGTSFDGLCSPHEKWLAFKPQQKPEIEKYISSKRMKLMQI